MSGLYFKYGTMNSSKTANLLMTEYNYSSQDFSTIILKPAIDTRCEENVVYSRVGLSHSCVMINDSDDIQELTKDYEVVFVDEAQFLEPQQVDELYTVSGEKVVLCYGLLTDFRRILFPASKRLMELADSIQEIKSICSCGKRAVANARITPTGEIITTGDVISIGAEDKYRALCRQCYDKKRIKVC